MMGLLLLVRHPYPSLVKYLSTNQVAKLSLLSVGEQKHLAKAPRLDEILEHR